MELKEAIEFLKDYADWVRQLRGTHPDAMGIAIDTVLKELDRLQIENEEKDNIIKDAQDELRHIPSAVSEMM